MKIAAIVLLAAGLASAQVFVGAQIPAETYGLANIADTLIATLDQVDVLALADNHQRTSDSDLRLAVIRHPQFAKKVRFILAEFAGTAEQSILDRYVNGEDLPLSELRRVWRNTCCPETWSSPVYAEFLAAVRDVNRALPREERIRVLGGDPPEGTPYSQRDPTAVAVLQKNILGKGKALVIYGSGHLGHGDPLAEAIHAFRPQGLYVVQAQDGPNPLFDPFLKSADRPVLFSARRPPFSQTDAADAIVYFGTTR